MFAANDGTAKSAAYDGQQSIPFVSVVAPAFNEARILEANLTTLAQYMGTLGVPWEIIVVNDGSSDETGRIADELASRTPGVRVIHHPHNFGLGRALRTGFAACSGRYVISVDIDLTYSTEHIGKLLQAQVQSHADVVLLSPYMNQGSVSSVPFLRKLFSVTANRCLSLSMGFRLHTATSMVRLYTQDALRALRLHSDGMEINLELLHQALVSGAKVKEIPAHLNWGSLDSPADRRSNLTLRRLVRQVFLVFRYSVLFIQARRFMAEGVVR
ncbi:MAG: glycosyltransferase family 2 protein [Bdellovibrionota bacterium]